MTIREYFGEWSDFIDLEEADRIMKTLSGNFCPLRNSIFRVFLESSPKNVRVVLLGQDPYPDLYKGEPRANGIAFANGNNIPEDSWSPSLKVLKESVIDYTVPHGPLKFDPTLEYWMKQGVLPLNTALTVRTGVPSSHSDLWRSFTSCLLRRLSSAYPGIVYVLLGSVAQSFRSDIASGFVFVERHPAYYVRQHMRMPSDIWRKVNTVLISQNGYGINWYKSLT